MIGHDPESRRMVAAYGRWSALGIEIAAAIVVCLLGGQWLDEKFGTGPWLALSGLVLGTATSGMILYKAAMAAQREAEKDL